jgi:hypothetical protein
MKGDVQPGDDKAWSETKRTFWLEQCKAPASLVQIPGELQKFVKAVLIVTWLGCTTIIWWAQVKHASCPAIQETVLQK